MPSASIRSLARFALAVLAIFLAGPVTLVATQARSDIAAAAVRDPGDADQPTSAPRGANALQDAAERAGQIGRVVALSMIGLALAAASVMLIFRRDFKEAAGIFAVGLLAVLLATPSGLNLLRNTAALIFGGQWAVTGDGRIEVRSFRTVFDLERRLYRIDRVRLNPGGVPVRGIVYGIALTVLVAVLAALPLLGWPLRALPWPARHLLLPTLLAAALTVVRVDGRPWHVAMRCLVALAVGPRRVHAWERVPRSAERWRPPDLVVIPDGSEAALRRACFRGPGTVLVGVAHELRRRHGRRVPLRPTGQGREPTRKVVVLANGSRLDIRPARGR